MTTIRALRSRGGEDDHTAAEARLDAAEPDDGADRAPPPDPAPPSDLPGNDSLDGLAHMAGVGRLARDAAVSAGAREGLEAMLAHELAAGHAFAMNVLCQANNQFLRVDRAAGDLDHMTRLNSATAATGLVGVRMMEAVQRGILILDRVRNGIRYSYTIEHVGGRPPGPTAAAGEDSRAAEDGSAAAALESDAASRAASEAAP